jgi:acetyl-CoA carboxylase biotin carboxyl carrier protein
MESLETYAALFERLSLTELSVEEGDRKLCLKKEPKIAVAAPAPALPAGIATENTTAHGSAENTPAATGRTGAAGSADRPQPQKAGEIVRSPLLGVFYARVGGEVRRVGEQVRKGDVLCTIEAMKMMNEVTSPVDGVIAEVLAADGALVEYNQELFVIA